MHALRLSQLLISLITVFGITAVAAAARSQNVWMELARYQDVTLANTAGQRIKHRSAAVLDKQLSVYERALSTCPHSVKIYLAMVRAAEELKSVDEVATKRPHWLPV